MNLDLLVPLAVVSDAHPELSQPMLLLPVLLAHQGISAQHQMWSLVLVGLGIMLHITKHIVFNASPALGPDTCHQNVLYVPLESLVGLPALHAWIVQREASVFQTNTLHLVQLEHIQTHRSLLVCPARMVWFLTATQAHVPCVHLGREGNQ